jgi:STE24 endopeptidase
MHLLRHVVFLCLLFPIAISARAGETSAEHTANVYAQQEMTAASRHGNLPDYSLSPDKLAKAQHLAKVRITLHFLNAAWSIVQLALLLWLGVVAWMRSRALGSSGGLREQGRWVLAFWQECLVFTFLFSLMSALLDLPLSLYSHRLSVQYGLSIQSWSSWFSDQAKSWGVTLLGEFLLCALLMWIIRSLPRTWWLAFWAVMMPLTIIAIYGMPLVIDPLFNTFEPLQQSQPALVAQLEKVVERGHMNIPPERMFLMKASAKTTTMNAYVTGFGNSKRVVVWDTSLAKGTPDEILFIFGHESGHYVLGHILRGIIMTFLGLFAGLYLAFFLVRWAIAYFGRQWRIPSQADWGALVVLLLVFTIFNTLVEPVTESLTRMQEHAADVYGQEAIHGIVADPQTTVKDAFNVLGDSSLEDPNPNPFVEFWIYSHPAVGRRAAFGKAYDPWAPGMEPKYFKR